mgnify:CR=1 FL=1
MANQSPRRRKISGGKREAVYVRDNWTCQYCGLKFNPGERFSDKMGSAPFHYRGGLFDYVALEIDHVHPVYFGGGNEVENLRAACSPCNRAKSFKVEAV